MKRLLANLSLTYTGSIFGFLVNIISAKMLGASEYSWVAFGMAVSGFAIPLLNLGNERTFVRDAVAVGQGEGLERMISIGFTFRVFMAMVLAIVLCVSSLLRAGSVTDAIAMFSISMWASLLGLYPASWYDYLHETRLHNFLILMERFASFAVVIALYAMPVFFHFAWILGVLLLLLRISSVVAQVKFWWKKYGKGRMAWVFSCDVRKIEGVNFKITAALLFNAMATYGNQLLLGGKGYKEELASYGFVFQLMSLIFIFQGVCIRLISRNIAETCINKAGVLKSICRYSLLVAGGSAVFALSILIGTRYLHLFISDSNFVFVGAYTYLLCIWIVVVAVGQVITQHSMALNQEGWYLCLAVLGGLMAFALGLVFVPIYGATGVASILLGVNLVLIMVELVRVVYVVRESG